MDQGLRLFSTSERFIKRCAGCFTLHPQSVSATLEARADLTVAILWKGTFIDEQSVSQDACSQQVKE